MIKFNNLIFEFYAALTRDIQAQTVPVLQEENFDFSSGFPILPELFHQIFDFFLIRTLPSMFCDIFSRKSDSRDSVVR